VTDQADDDRRTAMLLMAERLAELEPLARNRWLAFSDAELATLVQLLEGPKTLWVPEVDTLLGELRVERARRAREADG
jgi:hypothetical protein